MKLENFLSSKVFQLRDKAQVRETVMKILSQKGYNAKECEDLIAIFVDIELKYLFIEDKESVFFDQHFIVNEESNIEKLDKIAKSHDYESIESMLLAMDEELLHQAVFYGEEFSAEEDSKIRKYLKREYIYKRKIPDELYWKAFNIKQG